MTRGGKPLRDLVTLYIGEAGLKECVSIDKYHSFPIILGFHPSNTQGLPLKLMINTSYMGIETLS